MIYVALNPKNFLDDFSEILLLLDLSLVLFSCNVKFFVWKTKLRRNFNISFLFTFLNKKYSSSAITTQFLLSVQKSFQERFLDFVVSKTKFSKNLSTSNWTMISLVPSPKNAALSPKNPLNAFLETLLLMD